TQIAGVNPTMIREMKRLYKLTSGNSLAEALRIERDTSREFARKANLGEITTTVDSVIARGRTQAKH
ncbi:MAG TPA: hypothetical protein VJ728_00530, partial [Candidatus Binataceae bacterium]|nr:hypothetical protein [Candidatus Binataceae bacterium]